MQLQDAVIVITGASSGIGRATALKFAARGASVALAARSESQLQEVAAACERHGGRALAVPVDVTDESRMHELARQVLETFGRIDVWVNNAGVALFGRVEEVPTEDCHRLMATNFFGYLYGARAAIPIFREQDRGVLINVSSALGKMGQPYMGLYVASKFAINGLIGSLRMELLDAPDIHVCTVLPGSIDTPIWQHAANYTGRPVSPMEPIHSADEVAAAIVHLAEHPRREIRVGKVAEAASLLRLLAPPLYEKAMAMKVETDLFQDRPVPPTAGNLATPLEELNAIAGGWRKKEHRGGRFWLAGLSALGLGYALRRRFRT